MTEDPNRPSSFFAFLGLMLLSILPLIVYMIVVALGLVWWIAALAAIVTAIIEVRATLT